MGIRTKQNNGHTVLTVDGFVGSQTDLSAISRIVDECLSKGQKRVALALPADAFLGPEAIGSVIRSSHVLDNAGGRLVVISPTAQLRSVFKDLNLFSLVEIVDSHDVLSGG